MIEAFDIIFFSFAGLFILISIFLSDVVNVLRRNNFIRDKEFEDEILATRAVLLSLSALALLIYFGYPSVERLGLTAHILEWINLIVRWAHVVLGIAWIGASFYFIFLENSLNRTKNLRDELAGNLWAIHGGGFYYVEKLKNAPGVLPEKLHWFKYEAYFTWLTGMLLLTLVYYLNAKSFMVDPGVSDITPGTAILIGVTSLLLGWFCYDLMCRSPLLAYPRIFGALGFILLVSISMILTHYLSGRAAFIHVGALLGTIMAGNVFFVIIPAQKELVSAAKKNLPPDPRKGTYAGLRSLHNNYITLPVIFVMISNHFPGTFAPTYNWAILAVLTLGSVAVRHYINLYEKGKYASKYLFFGAISLFALVFITAPRPKKTDSMPVSFSEVQPIIQKRCLSCHSSNPTDDIQKIAPNGVLLETPEEIAKMSDRILFRVVQTKTMPQGNKTGITDEERDKIGRWIHQGARISE